MILLSISMTQKGLKFEFDRPKLFFWNEVMNAILQYLLWFNVLIQERNTSQTISYCECKKVVGFIECLCYAGPKESRV